MKYYSTKNKANLVDFKEAVIEGLPSDNGLFMPESIPQLEKTFINSLSSMSLSEIGYEIAKPFVKGVINDSDLKNIVHETLSFDIPLRHVHDDIYALELYHGPTLAFKDVGARFLARCLSHFSQEKVTVLVATSGDTGSAVAHGFLGVENVDVVILYPSGKVSKLQEQQLATLGQNIQTLEVDGTFDDCQRMVKTAFLDKSLKQAVQLTSANSINIARLLPQSFYYFWAYSQLAEEPVYISVPSGNYGNLTAGLLAKAMELPISGFVASSNINDIVPTYLNSGNYSPKPSKQTISNAMDVGDPSNFQRMLALYNGDRNAMTKDIAGYSFDDEQTKSIIKQVFEKHNYLLDPHGAVGYLGLTNHLKKHQGTGIFLETAHPAKFDSTIKEVIGSVNIPERLSQYLDKPKKSVRIGNDFNELKEFLLDR